MTSFAIGDIHGLDGALDQLIQVLKQRRGLSQKDHLIFVGDYIDRGPKSRQVIDYLLELRQEIPCTFLMGNHEALMLDSLNLIDRRINHNHPCPKGLWMSNGGITTMESYGIVPSGPWDQLYPEDFPPLHIEFLQSLIFHYSEGSKLVVHAGVDPFTVEYDSIEKVIAATTKECFVWDRTSFNLPNKFGTLICGHTPAKKGVRFKHRLEEGDPPHSVCIDTGAVFGYGSLAALDLDTWEVVQWTRV